MHQRHLRINGTLRIRHVIDRQDEHVKQVAAQQVAHRHVHGANAHCAPGGGQFGDRGCQGDEQRANKGVAPAHQPRQLDADHGQPDAGTHNHHGRHAIAHQRGLEAHAGFDGLGAHLMALFRHVKRAHGCQINPQQQYAGQADVAHGRHHALRTQQQRQRGACEQDHAEAGRHQVAVADLLVQAVLAVKNIDQGQDEQVEGTTAQHIAHRNVGCRCHRDRAQARDQLGQRGHRGQQDQADPVARQAGMAGNGITIAAQAHAGKADQAGTQPELQPDQNNRVHGASGPVTRLAARWRRQAFSSSTTTPTKAAAPRQMPNSIRLRGWVLKMGLSAGT